jgi:4-amino-4-deoxychorismate lyase
MSLLIESIKVWNGRLCHLPYHEMRANRSRRELLGVHEPVRWADHIVVPDSCRKGLFKCRVVFGHSIEEICFTPYKTRKIQSLKLVYTSGVKYSHKLLERQELDVLWAQRQDCDEIIIVNDDLLTDAYYYNLVFQKGNTWITPDTPLLEGVRRQLLLDKNQLITQKLCVGDIRSMDKVHLINALTPLGKITVDISKIF